MQSREPFSSRLYQERRKLGLSQAQLADKLGVDPKTVSRWEQGTSFPAIHLHKELSDLFGKPPVELGLFEEHDTKDASPAHKEASQSNSEQKMSAILSENAQVDHTRLFGVDTLIADLGELLSAPNSNWIISLFGEGGLGKTALAYELVTRYAETAGFTRLAWVSAKSLHLSLDGVLLRNSSAEFRWINLIKKMADQLEIALGYNSVDWMKDFQQGMHSLPAGEKCLLVIDNLETVEDVSEAIHYLCANQVIKPHKILVTTRYALLGKASPVAEKQISGLEAPAALAFIRSLGNKDVEQATDEELQPVLNATEGNPLLIKLFVTRFLVSHLPLKYVLQELKAVNKSFGKSIVDYLYTESLTLLEQQCGEDEAHGLMNAFCPLSAGESVDYDDLLRYSGIEETEAFHNALRLACDLALIRSLKLNSKYSIHSLLWNFICT